MSTRKLSRNLNRLNILKYHISHAKIDFSIYRSAEEKNTFFAFTPLTKILKRELSRRKLAQTFFLREISLRNLWFNVPVNNYGHVETVS